VLLLTLLLYGLISYILLPSAWLHYEHEPALEAAPKTTESSLGFSGDPLNVALVGTKEELLRAMLETGWQPSDRVTLRSSVRIATSILLNRSYPQAPMSNLYLWGRQQDLAFQEPSGKSPRKRHHVRFWESQLHSRDGRPLWIGAATYDEGIGFDQFTARLTHHIAPDVDAERDALFADLVRQKQLTELHQVTGVGLNIAGRNAQGDWYYTDGELTVGILSPGNVPVSSPPQRLANPAAVDWKNQGWQFLRSLMLSTYPQSSVP